MSVAQGDEMLRLSRMLLEMALLAEHPSRVGVATEQLVVGALEDYRATLAASTRPHVDDMVGQTDHLLVVFDQQHRVARIAQAADRMLHLLDIVVVQSCGRLVEDV